ncbi:hypothetical protein RCL_jg4887.t1 [Rhizophagus clarus]|uniref:Uncharacterized protein n=1 Tax=Rhizophagus clarus TaxID=94130 RepID=A0A8H3MCN2_9GLOM|nr:hypothetical protein RCL_jg4887.t1 [Rhizophagus clarus]
MYSSDYNFRHFILKIGHQTHLSFCKEHGEEIFLIFIRLMKLSRWCHYSFLKKRLEKKICACHLFYVFIRVDCTRLEFY